MMLEHTAPSGWLKSEDQGVLAEGEEVHHNTQWVSVYRRENTYRKSIITAEVVTRTPENYTIVDRSL
jgi:hypothetical protein